jgi:hypothetical protein
MKEASKKKTCGETGRQGDREKKDGGAGGMVVMLRVLGVVDPLRDPPCEGEKKGIFILLPASPSPRNSFLLLFLPAPVAAGRSPARAREGGTGSGGLAGPA